VGYIKEHNFDLSTKREWEEINVSEYFTTFAVKNLEGLCYIKFNAKNEPSHLLNDISYIKGMETVEKFYLYNEKQEGKKLSILTGNDVELMTSQMNSVKITETVGLKSNQVNFDDENNDLIVKPRNSKIEDSIRITPSDTDIIDLTSGIYIGSMGDLKVRMKSGNIETFKDLSNGIIHPIRCDKIFDTGTTASSVLALY